MAKPATTRQKQYLRRLGHKDVASLTKEQASHLIDKLLAEEKASGKTFPCPYCKARFGPRPRRQLKCPTCGNKIIHLSGKFFTAEQADAHFQRDWLKDTRSDRNSDIKMEWQDERQYRKEFGEAMLVGYMVTPGPHCPHANKIKDLLILIEDAYDTPDFLPPYDECQHDSCECEYTSVTASEVPRKTRIAEWTDPAQCTKLKTRSNSSISTQKRNAGCANTLIWIFLAVVSMLMLLGVAHAN